jgi:hypothetical protein
VYMYTYCAQCGDGGRGKEILKNGTSVNVACQGKLSACHCEHACHRFAVLY